MYYNRCRVIDYTKKSLYNLFNKVKVVILAEITVGTWNALNAFGDERSKQAFEVVKRMDVDVLNLPETALRGVAPDQLDEINDAMKGLGYVGCLSDYSPYPEVRNMHLMSVWSRAGSRPTTKAFGNRYGFKLILPEISIYGVHFDDSSETERVASADATLDDWSENGSAVVMGDLNAMHRQDWRSRLPRVAGRLGASNILAGLTGIKETGDFYNDDRKPQRAAGKIIRVCGMARGDALQRFTDAGFRDADPSCRPTRTGFQLDHIFASAGVEVADFEQHTLPDRGGKPISDHVPITAQMRF